MSSWNHAVWILNDKEILEVRNKNIKICSLSIYLNSKLYDIKVVKLKKISKFKIEKAINIAKESLGRLSYWRWVISLFLILVRYPWDLPQFTCSGLIAESLYHCDWKFKNKPRHLISPEDINNSKNTITIS